MPTSRWHAFCYPNPVRKCLIVNDLRGGPAQVLDNQRLTKALINYPYILLTLIRRIYGIYGNSGEISIYLHCKAFILKHLFHHAGRRLSALVSRGKIIISKVSNSHATFGFKDDINFINVLFECHNFIRIQQFASSTSIQSS